MKTIFKGGAFAAVGLLLAGCAHLSSGNPATNHGDLVAAANKEGRLVVYSVTSAVPLLLKDFSSLYPGIKLDYVTLDTTPLYQRIISESASSAGPVADVAWSSAMDLQIKLVNDGHAMAYASPEAAHLPAWAVWRDQAYGTTTEPVGFVYNRTLLDAAEAPRTHAEFAGLLNAKGDKFRGKVTTFDPQKSGLGYMLMTQDMDVSSQGFWSVAQSLSAADVYPGAGSGAQFMRIGTGESLIGYNLLGSYAAGRIKKDLPQLALVLPKDYTLVMSRIMFINKKAVHPNAAKLWVDYVLSKRGQAILAQSDLGSVRADVEGDLTLTDLRRRLGTAMKPIPVGPALLTYLDPGKRLEFLNQWKASAARAAR